MQSEQIADLAAALAKAQSTMRAATLNKTNPHFKNKYADLAAVLEAIRKPLCDNGLSVTQTMETRDGHFVLVTTLRHGSGQWIASEYPLPANAKPQELGSALTYARRYSISALACIAADEDDDANAASKNGNGPCITDEQADAIRDLLTKTKANVDVFLQYIGAPSIADIPRSQYQRAVSALEIKLKRTTDVKEAAE